MEGGDDRQNFWPVGGNAAARYADWTYNFTVRDFTQFILESAASIRNTLKKQSIGSENS
jgi:hypothetical protein